MGGNRLLPLRRRFRCTFDEGEQVRVKLILMRSSKTVRD